MKHVPWAIVALCCLMPAIRSADVAVCANDFPDPKPWETEADTLWEPWMLEPTPAVDDASPIAQTAASAVAPSSRLSHLFGGSAADAAEAVSAAHVCDGRVALLSAKVPVLEAVPGALANASAAAAGTLEPGGFGAVFVVANGENDGVWLRYHPTCLGTLVRTFHLAGSSRVEEVSDIVARATVAHGSLWVSLATCEASFVCWWMCLLSHCSHCCWASISRSRSHLSTTTTTTTPMAL